MSVHFQFHFMVSLFKMGFLSSTSRIVFIFFTLQPISFSEFRFCYHGPHQFNSEDCPGGVLFSRPIPTTCAAFIKRGDIGDGRATINGDMCDSTVSEDSDMNEQSPMHTFNVPKLQELMYDGDPLNPSPGADASSAFECSSACLRDWTDPQYVDDGSSSGNDSQMTEPVYKYPTLSDAAKAEQEGISEQLFLKLLLNEDINDGGSELRVAKLLKASFLVLNTYCPEPYVSLALLNKTFDSFVFLAGKGNETVRDVGVREYGELMNVLAQCRVFDVHNSFQLIGKNCSETPMISGAIFKSRTGPPVVVPPAKGAQKTLKRMDPFIEASWQAISFINAQCFRNFKDDFNLHHIYEVAMEALFTDLVLQRWPNPPKLKNQNFWNNLMGSSNFEAELTNMNSCVRYAYYSNPYKKRLERPYKSDNGTAGPGEEEAGGGWPGTEAEYWESYKSKGGFPAIAHMFGATCFKSDADRADAASAMTAGCELQN